MDPIDEIKQRLDIVSFITPYVPLKQAGRNFKGLCPFHGEKTPSFMVTPDRQIWHCFGCNKGGDVISFYQQIENLEFYEALQALAERTSVVLKYQEPEQVKHKNSLVQINELAAKFYHHLLIKHPIGKIALEYIMTERKVLAPTLETFRIGYAPEGFNHLHKFLKKHGISEKDAHQAGLLSKNDRGYFDMFRGRIMFPIYDHRGTIVAFAGRVLDKEAKTAKYINTPETPLYIKGNTLFGLYQNAEAIKQAGSIILVEGELDVLSSYQAGVRNVVAMKGTALTANQIALIRRYANVLLLALDQDAAGQTATRRSIELAQEAGLTMRIVSLPYGKDVDDLAKASPKSWKNAVDQAKPYYDWLINRILTSYDLADPFQKSKAASEAMPFIQRIDNEIIREHYFKLLATSLDTSIGSLLRAQGKERAKPRTEASKSTPHVTQDPKDIIMLRSILATLVQAPHAEQYLIHIIEELANVTFSQAAESAIWQHIVKHWQPEKTTIQKLLASLPNEYAPALDLLSVTEIPEALLRDPVKVGQELDKLALNIKKWWLKSEIAELSRNLGAKNVELPEKERLSKQYSIFIKQLASLSK